MRKEAVSCRFPEVLPYLFQYALYGRGRESGILKKCKPIEFEAEIEDFFKLWRAEYRKERVLRAVL